TSMKEVQDTQQEMVARQAEWNLGDALALSGSQQRFFRIPRSLVSLNATTAQHNSQTFETQFRQFIGWFPTLCLRFEPTDTGVKQRWVPHQEVPVEFMYRDSAKMKQLTSTSEFYKPFDLFDGPLIRVLVITDASDEQRATVVVHVQHSLLDAYSAGVIEKRLRAYLNGDTTPFATTTTYFDFVKWQEAFISSELGMQKRAFWKEFLKEDVHNSAEKQIPLEVDGFVEQRALLTSNALQGLQTNAESHQVPISAMLFANYLKLLERFKMKEQSVCGVMVDGREQQIPGLDTDGLLGVIDNLLPLPMRILESGADDNEASIQSVYSTYLEARMHQQIPYTVIRSDVKKEFGLDLDACMAGQFNFQVRPYANTDSNTEEEVTFGAVEHHLMPGIHLNCIAYSNALDIRLLYKESVYKEMEYKPDLKDFLKHLIPSNETLKKQATPA
ncbi:MAG: condensation domain-containing protein, partial [Bacteroidota bacterium]